MAEVRRVAVVGAGPAGCSAAVFLARRGVEVVMLDRARFPRPKPCGEGVMPQGLAVLEELGVLAQVRAAGRPYRGIRFTSREGRGAQGLFPGGRFGLVVRRERLDALLLERAKALPGIRVLEGSRAVGPLQRDGRVAGVLTGEGAAIAADFTVVADGIASDLARRLAGPRSLPARRRFGLRAHFRGVEGLGDLVEVFLLSGGEAYLAPQPGGEALVSLLLEERALARFAGGSEAAFLETVASAGGLRDRFRHARRITPIAGAGPLGGTAPSWSGPGWCLAGDAAGSVDPITGEGVSLALLNGRLAASEIASGFDARAYGRKRRALMREKTLLSRALLAATAGPFFSELAVGAFALAPRAFDRILAGC